jgi:acetoin utilization protein AcuB
MTPVVHTITMEMSLPEAQRLLEEHGIRHLPVVDGEKLVGVISDRDIARLEGFPMVNFNSVSVADAMSSRPYSVGPETDLVEVVRTMAANKYGSAIVVEGRRVSGIFTVVDALKILAGLLEA